MKNCLVFYTSTNRKGKKDATGAFIPEAKAFQNIYLLPDDWMVPIAHHLTPGKRRAVFESYCLGQIGRTTGKMDAIVYFGHGVPRGLPGLGMTIGNLGPGRMADVIAPIIHPHGKVILYACLAGKGFGFADRLDITLAERGLPGVVTVSHITKGHTSWNPKTEYSGEGPVKQGRPIITRDDPLWKKWVDRLRNDQTFRLTFPFMSEIEIRDKLNEEHIPPGPSKLRQERV